MSKKCTVKNKKGKRCGAWAINGGTKCPLHSDPRRAALLGSKHGSRAVSPADGEVPPLPQPKTAGDVRDTLGEIMVQVHGRRLDPRRANTLGYLANFLLRAGELADVEKQEPTRKAWEALEPSHDARIQEATSDPYLWATQYTQTYNEHWVEEGRPSPYEHFPAWPYLEDLFEIFRLERIVWIEKSRDMMISWACVAYLTLQAMTVPERGVLFQTQKLEKVKELIKYSKCLYRQQPQWLRDAFPLEKSLKSQSDTALRFAHGGNIRGIPGGADQIRTYHPWGYLNDESSFQPDAGECYNESLSAVSGKIIFNSSAGPGWYADARHGIIRNAEE